MSTTLNSSLHVGGYDFLKVCSIEPDRNADGTIRELVPYPRYQNARGFALNRYGVGPFCHFKIPAIRNSGVYLIVVSEQVKYIGECANLGSRYNSGYGTISPRKCFSGGQETNCRVNNLILLAAKRSQEISLWFLQTDAYKAIEQDLRTSHRPDWNRR